MEGERVLLMCIPGLQSADPKGQEHGQWNQAFTIASQIYPFIYVKEILSL